MALVNPRFEMTPLVCATERHLSESAVRLSPHAEPTDWGWVQGLLTCLNLNGSEQHLLRGRRRGVGEGRVEGRTPNTKEAALAEGQA